MMKIKKTRMSSYVDRGNKLIADGKTPEAMKLVECGLQYYSEKIINAISPYAKADAGMIILVLRYLADEVENYFRKMIEHEHPKNHKQTAICFDCKMDEYAEITYQTK